MKNETLYNFNIKINTKEGEKNMNILQKQNGITLVALIITIIILLLLAGITIGLLSGEDGIISKAEKAVIKNEIASAQEDLSLIVEAEKIEYYKDNLKEKGFIEYLYDKYKDVTEIESGATIFVEKIEEELEVTYTDKKGKDIGIFNINSNGIVTFEGSVDSVVYKIEVELEKEQIEVREKTNLIITVKPDRSYNKEVNISYDDTKISIGEKNIQEDGTIKAEVTGVEAGETNIVVTLEKGRKNLMAECSINIVNPQPINVFQTAGTWSASQYLTESSASSSYASVSGNQLSWTCPKSYGWWTTTGVKIRSSQKINIGNTSKLLVDSLSLNKSISGSGPTGSIAVFLITDDDGAFGVDLGEVNVSNKEFDASNMTGKSGYIEIRAWVSNSNENSGTFSGVLKGLTFK